MVLIQYYNKEIQSTSYRTPEFITYLESKLNPDFFSIENLGVECTPRCGGCRCGKCPLGTKDYSLKEEKELQLIENSLEFDEIQDRWIAAYPWIKDPADLPNNRRAAWGMLTSTEKRLARNPSHAKVYQEQM